MNYTLSVGKNKKPNFNLTKGVYIFWLNKENINLEKVRTKKQL